MLGSCFLGNCGMCPWGPQRAEGRCFRQVTIAWCSPCSSCCCPMTSLSIPFQSYSEWLLSFSWCSSCEFSGWDWTAKPSILKASTIVIYSILKFLIENYQGGKKLGTTPWYIVTSQVLFLHTSDKSLGYREQFT